MASAAGPCEGARVASDRGGPMDDYLRAVLLGLVQALTEFLPVSSSGHLVLGAELLGEDVSSLTFDVGLHTGTTVAVIAYFRRDWGRIIAAGLRDLATHGRASSAGANIRGWGCGSRSGPFPP